ncbi:MFS transporter [Candidatus Hodarchaeum mangrovi]
MNYLANLATLSAFTFVPLWGKELGLTDPEIAAIAALYALIAFSSGLITGRLSDKFANRKLFIIFGSITGMITISGLLIPEKTWFAISRIMTGLGFGTLPPSLVALVSDKGEKIGNFSSFGSLGWASGVLISGVLGLFWVPAIFIFGILALGGATILAFSIREDSKLLGGSYENNLTKESFFEVFWHRKSAYFTLAIRHSFAQSIWTFWPLFLLGLGANTFWIAIIQTTNALTQFMIMQYYTDKIPSKLMIYLGLIFSALSFFSFTLTTDYWGIIPTQIVLGISWAFTYVGTLRYSVEKSDFDKSSSAGILTSTLAISGIFGPLIALMIIALGGGYIQIMIVAAIVTALTLLGFWLSQHLSL